MNLNIGYCATAYIKHADTADFNLLILGRVLYTSVTNHCIQQMIVNHMTKNPRLIRYIGFQVFLK